jgi:hypothetical protein
MAAARKRIPQVSAVEAEATPVVPPPTGAPAAEPTADEGAKSVPDVPRRRGRRPAHDEAELARIGRQAAELYNQGARTSEIFATLGIKRQVLKRAWARLGIPMPKPGVRAPGSVLTIPDHPPAQTAPTNNPPARRAPARPPAASRDQPAPQVAASNGDRVTVELPLEDLVRANRTAILRILLRDLEAQSPQ